MKPIGRVSRSSAPRPDVAPPIVHAVLRTPGTALGSEARAEFEPRFGHDFGAVRVHNDALAQRSAEAVGARAYTVGNHVVFGQGEYRPGTAEGIQVLRHELAHVVQQDGAQVPAAGRLTVSSPGDACEWAADRGETGAGVGPQLMRWTNLGTESWTIKVLGSHSMTVWTGTKEEWLACLANMDDEDEYDERLAGFLQVSNDPSLVHRHGPPSYIAADPESVAYVNTITRAPNDAEKLAFLEALYEKGGDLDLWHGGFFEGGPFVSGADKALSQFIRDNQVLYLRFVSQRETDPMINEAGVTAVASQGGREATIAMITSAAAAAFTGLDLLAAANRLQGHEQDVAKLHADELIRNSGRTIRQALIAHNDRVAFEKSVVGFVFEQVWGALMSVVDVSGYIAGLTKTVVKMGLQRALDGAMKDSGPQEQMRTIGHEFTRTCHLLVDQGGHLTNDDVRSASNWLEIARP
ncbi:eCIS core domain-containing protein [Streptomyces sp. NPDC002758]